MSASAGTIILCGDLFPLKENMQDFENGNLEALYDQWILDKFKEADFSLCNLEGALTDSMSSIMKSDPVIKAASRAIKGIKGLGVSCVTLANNHVLDGGAKGYLDTCATLDANGIAYFGAGRNSDEITNHYTVAVGGRRVTIYTVAETMFNIPRQDYPGVNLYDEYRVCRELKELKTDCDYLIVTYHGGTELFWYNTPLIRQRFHRMADNGADVVLAQHTHNIGVQEIYNGNYLCYGQGDFLFPLSVNEYKSTGLMLELTIDESGMHVKRHLLRHVGGKVIYDPEQNMEQFEDRDARYASGDDFCREYAEYSNEKLFRFLVAFRGECILDKVVRKVCPREAYFKYLKRRYTDRQILRIISSLEFEEFREFVVNGLWNMIYERHPNARKEP